MADTSVSLPFGNRNRSPLNLDSVRTLLKMQGPSNMAPADPYMAKRQAQIVGGDDALAPTELEQLDTQLKLGDRGVGVSRDMIRDSGIGGLRQKLGLMQSEEAAKAAGPLAVSQQQGKNALDVANANNAAVAPGRAATTAHEQAQTNLLESASRDLTGGGTPGRFRRTITANGDVSFTEPTQIESAQDRQRTARMESAAGFLSRLNQLREKINTKMGPEAGIMGTYRRAMAKMGMDPDVAEYERERMAGGRSLAVAIMGAQNLSDADAESWANMLPGATTDRETARRLTDQVGRMLRGENAPAEPNADDPYGLF